LALAGVVGAAVAHAEVVGLEGSYVVPEPEFWEKAIEPHAADVRTVLEKANLIIQQIPYFNDSDPSGQTRQRAVEDGIGMLRYARRLAPLNTDVLLNLGVLADEGGQAELSLAAFASFVEQTEDQSKVPSEVYMRLGRIHARLRDHNQAIRQLRKALAASTSTGSYSSFQYSQGHARVALSSALAAVGRLADAIDTLKTYLATTQYYGDEASIQVGFALAVAYDRDEQRSNAFDMLDLLINASQGSYGMMAYNALAHLSFTPSIDRHYFSALLYESLGYLPEARTEWSAYARGGEEAWFRDRALDHVAAIDILLESKLVETRAARNVSKKRTSGAVSPPVVIP
jgi:tetratricopeptide (TPR) repeat protein